MTETEYNDEVLGLSDVIEPDELGIVPESDEEWLPVADYEHLYEVSNRGRVVSVHDRYNTGGYLKGAVQSKGYLTVSLCRDKQQKTLTVHRLVAKAFIPNPEAKPQVNHKNGIKTDNRVENLEWVTASENGKHAYETGLFAPTSMHSKESKNRVLSPKDVLEILKDNRTQKEIAQDYGVKANTVSRIKTGKRWPELHKFHHTGQAPSWLYHEAAVEDALRVLEAEAERTLAEEQEALRMAQEGLNGDIQ